MTNFVLKKFNKLLYLKKYQEIYVNSSHINTERVKCTEEKMLFVNFYNLKRANQNRQCI